MHITDALHPAQFCGPIEDRAAFLPTRGWLAFSLCLQPPRSSMDAESFFFG